MEPVVLLVPAFDLLSLFGPVPLFAAILWGLSVIQLQTQAVSVSIRAIRALTNSARQSITFLDSIPFPPINRLELLNWPNAEQNFSCNHLFIDTPYCRHS